MTEMPEQDALYEGKDEEFMDVDRMTNEGLGGGYVTDDGNAKIGDTTTDSMDDPESISQSINRYHGMFFDM